MAEHDRSKYVALKEIAAEQDISQKYLESIMTILSKADLIDSQHGKGGGYRLNRDASQYTVGSILRLTENSLAPVSCLSTPQNTCEKAAKCRTLPMWTKLHKLINDYFDNITLADFIQDSADNYII